MSGRDAFAAAYPADVASLDALQRYVDLLGLWQARMNLVAPSTLADAWDRHVADSAQLASLAGTRDATTWLDIGSGAGFPALVLARLCPGHFHLVEATTKKCSFLAAAAEALGVTGRVTIHNTRIEALPTLAADIVTARACAALPQLFAWGARFARGQWLLPKGRTAAAEIAAATVDFTFDHELVASRTDADARIVVARNVRRRGG
ncbi:MAG: 16S rRNA (guanine(527)-N(7))-methyltransferase RsmG [Sphingomonadaceae bacterium]|nr:16S rRNA (guanine(527)-N(7))-methyltransferase RsmG [Sphingomonadaceae bacterium]